MELSSPGMNSNRDRLAIFLCLAICLLAFSSRVYCQAASANQPVVLDAPMRQKLIDNVIRELNEKYVAPEKVKGIETHLRTKLQSGAYDKLTRPDQFASAVTTDLRTAGKDLHLFVTYDPVLEARLIAAPATPSFELQELPPTPEQLARLRESNYDFRKLEVLSGNVGYLDLRTFVDLNLSKDTAVAAMNFLANTDAVVIDLRHNPGGFINLEIFLISYFYGFDPVELWSRYHREGNVTMRDWSLREVPGKRLQHTDLYVLTSRATGSAGEGFSFILQQRRRAKIVGEKTSGAGYGNKETPIGNGFVFYVSTFRQFDPRTGRSWQEVGVEPDISVPAERALSAAHLEAVKNLAGKSSDADRKKQLSWLAGILQVEAYGPKEVPASLLSSYVGKYDGGKIVVSLVHVHL